MSDRSSSTAAASRGATDQAETSGQADAAPDRSLESEIGQLLDHLRRMRDEIAQLAEPDGESTRFRSMSAQLDAIANGTEQAANTILGSMERVDELVGEIRAADDAATRGPLCDKVQEETTRSIEACTFQDIAGQRVSRVVRSMEAVEARIESIIAIWGADAIRDAAAATDETETPGGSEIPLEGPALPGEETTSQEEIDKLFD